MSDELEFPENHWDELRLKMEAGGAAAVKAWIEAFEDPVDRLKLYNLAQRGFSQREWEGKRLDPQIEVVRAGIEEALRQREAVEDEETRAKRLEFANVSSYNLAADLAECWPGDLLPRSRQHFEEGLRAAEDCLRWRAELNKGAWPFSIAWWAKGMHQLSLGETAEAVRSFDRSLEFARVHAEEQRGGPVEPREDFGLALGLGYLGIAEHLAGELGGKPRYEGACDAFAQMAADEERRSDAEFGRSQLQHVWAKFVGVQN